MPTPTRCPACGFLDATIVCRYCKADKSAPHAPMPAEACTDLGAHTIRTPYPWCHGSPTKADCAARGYCNRDPNCGE